jgi:hypothetical protein
MTLAVYDNTLVPTLPQMTDAPMAAIKVLRIQAVQPPHALHEIGFRRFNEHVVMIVHQTIRVASPPVLVDLPPQDGEKPIAVDRIEKDNLLGIAPGRQMIHGTRKLHA